MTIDATVGTRHPRTRPDLLVALDLQTGVLRVAGELDRLCAHHLTAAVLALAASGTPTWTLDLRDVGFCDVEGLRVLDGAQRLARSRGRLLRLRHVPPLIAQLLPLVGPEGQARLVGDRAPVRLVPSVAG